MKEKRNLVRGMKEGSVNLDNGKNNGKGGSETMREKDLVKEMIDRYAELDEKIKKLNEEKEDLRKRLIELLGVGKWKGYNCDILIVAEERVELNPEKVYHLLGLETFLKSVKVRNEIVRNLLGGRFEECVDTRKKIHKVQVINE